MSKASVCFTLGGFADQHDRAAIKRELDQLPGVNSVSVGGNGDRVAVDFDTTGVQPDRIRKRLETLGCEIRSVRMDEHIM